MQGELLPSVNLVGQYSRGWNTVADSSKSETVIAQAQVTVPIYQQGAEYSRLRQADRLGLSVLVCVPPPEVGVGVAVNDRLRRAAAS